MAAQSNTALPERAKPEERLRIVVLLSGRGSNFRAIADACDAGAVRGEVVAVISDRTEAEGLALARQRGIDAHVVLRGPKDRPAAEFFSELADTVLAARPDAVVLAGFMRIVTPQFIERCGPSILNIHPSLLPAFRGIHAQAQALAAGVKFTGCTVHVVVPELDSGPILDQAVVPVERADTVESLSARILREEHRLLPKTLQALAEGTLEINRGPSGAIVVVDRRGGAKAT